MNLQEAYSILELSRDATPEDAKKQYKKLAKELHPDVNKDPGAEDRFKKINEAYKIVSTGESTDRAPPQNSWDGFFNNNVDRQITMLHLHTIISFYDSVVGTKQDLKYKRETKCATCGGQGISLVNNGCDKCGGKGKVMIQNGHSIMIKTCEKCQGKVNTKSCSPCSGAGVMQSDVSVSVIIPPGVQNENTLRLSGMGNFIGSFGPIDQYADVYLHIKVTPEEGLSVENQDVVSSINLSLLEALTGCDKNIKTIMGNKNITIKPKSRHKEEIQLPNLGVNKKGCQRVILNINYPDNVDKLIESLKN